MSQRTFTIIKPDSFEKKNAGKIISRLETEGFEILGMKKVSLTKAQAEGFYAIHGSDSPENGEIEIAFFFSQSELM